MLLVADYPFILFFFFCRFKHLLAFHKFTFILSAWGWRMHLYDKRWWLSVPSRPFFMRALWACVGCAWRGAHDKTEQVERRGRESSNPSIFQVQTHVYLHLCSPTGHSVFSSPKAPMTHLSLWQLMLSHGALPEQLLRWRVIQVKEMLPSIVHLVSVVPFDKETKQTFCSTCITSGAQEVVMSICI